MGSVEVRVKEVRDFLSRVSLEDGVVAVAYSGGKDSTALLDIVLKSFPDRRIVVLHGNTLVENPVIHKHSLEFLGKLQKWAKEEGRKVEVKVYEPDEKFTFWVNLIGKGYPLPYYSFRWCQRHLKINPSVKALKGFKGALLTGMRKSESAKRKSSMQRRLNGYSLGKNGSLESYAPLMDWNEEDVWEYLLKAKSPWGESYQSVASLYRDARGECPLIPEKGQNLSGCGSRFGCWVCTLVNEDKTLKNQAEKDPVLRKLYEFRSWMKSFLQRPESRSGYRRNGAYVGYGKGKLNRESREEVLKRLTSLQKSLKMTLIRESELRHIYECWEEER